jgi:hypothetical protein
MSEPFLRLVIVVNYGLAAITVSIFLLDHGLAVMWLPLLDDSAFTISIMVTRLANRNPGADRTRANANFIRKSGRRDSHNHCGSK